MKLMKYLPYLIICLLIFFLVVQRLEAQTIPATISAAWISTNTARIAWSTGGCVDRQRGQARTRVACTDSADARDVDAAQGDFFVLEYNDSVHGQGEVDTQLGAFCGAFLPVVEK